MNIFGSDPVRPEAKPSDPRSLFAACALVCRRAILCAGLSAAILIAFTSAAAPSHAAGARFQEVERLTGIVGYVTDGDTAWVGGTKIRFWGIAAPDDDRPAAYVASKRAMIALIGGKELTCQLNGETSYDRKIGRCFLAAGDVTGAEVGADVGALMVRSGWAEDNPMFSGGAYAADERRARRERLGLWAAGSPPERAGQGAAAADRAGRAQVADDAAAMLRGFADQGRRLLDALVDRSTDRSF